MSYWFDLPAKFETLENEHLKLGSEIIWKDENDEIIVKGTIITLEEGRKLTTSIYEYDWNLELAPEDMAYTYTLSHEGEKTLLMMECGDFAKVPGGKKTFEGFKATLENAELQKIKFLAEWLSKLEAEGYNELRVCPLPPKESFGDHTHDLPTAHVILRGELEIKDSTGKYNYKMGDFIEFPSGTCHEAKGLSEEGSMIVGEKI